MRRRFRSTTPSVSSQRAFAWQSHARTLRFESLEARALLAVGAELLADINTLPSSSDPDQFTTVGDLTFFTADDGVRGRELWVTDGTSEGTKLVKDILSGPGSANPHLLTSHNGHLFFTTSIATWRSDGTEAGTFELVGGPISGDPVVLGEWLYFVAYDGVLYRTTGAPDQTLYVEYFADGNIRDLTAMGDQIFFTVDDRQHAIDFGKEGHGRELWKSNGESTELVKDIRFGEEGSDPRYLQVVDGVLYFSATNDAAGTELWKSDGSAAGTTLVKDLRPGTSGSGPRNLFDAGEFLLFNATSTGSTTLWKSDGTADGTFELLSSPGADFFVQDGAVYFRSGGNLWTTDGSVVGTIQTNITIAEPPFPKFFARFDPSVGNELWGSEGTEESAFFLKDLRTENEGAYPQCTAELNDVVYFRAMGILWRSDGTSSGTVPVETNSLLSKIDPCGLFTVDTEAFFNATYDGIRTLWRTDGSEGGTYSLNAPAATIFAIEGNTAFFVSDSELWSTDGTLAGTNFVIDLGVTPNSIVRIGSYFVFTAGVDLWTTDGTPTGTIQITNRDGVPPYLGDVFSLTKVGSTAYFSGYGFGFGQELWKTDGTVNGTQMVMNLGYFTDGSYPSFLTDLNDILYFVARNTSDDADDEYGYELRSLDGVVRDIVPGNGGSNPYDLTVVNDRIVFKVARPSSLPELWVSDGTGPGTFVLKNIKAELTDDGPTRPIVREGVLYFVGDDGLHGREVWRTDGTIAGTRRVSDVGPRELGGNPEWLTVSNNRVFYTADDAAHGRELWASSAQLPELPTAGGPYEIHEGEGLQLDGFDSIGDIERFQWDINGDGDFTDATGPLPFLSWSQLQALGIEDGQTTFPIRVRLIGHEGAAVDSAAASLTVRNTPPTILLPAQLQAVEGMPVYLDLSVVSDPGADTVSQWFVDWGDGQSETFDTPGPHGHRYADGPAVHTILVGLADEDGSYLNLASATVTVEDAAPTIELVGLPSVSEGSPYSLELGTVTDLGLDNVFEWIVYWGDGTTESFSVGGAHSHVYLDGAAERTIRVDVRDEDGLHLNAGMHSVTVLDVPPSIDLDGPPTIAEGADFELMLGSITDPGIDTVTEWVVHWGNGAIESFNSPGVKTHRYANGPNVPQIVVDLRDEDGLHLNAGTFALTVTNVAPLFSDLSVVDGSEGGPTRLLGTIVDPGSIDSFTVEVNWGDGTPLDVYTIGAGERTFQLSHVYVDDDPTDTASDIYAIALTVRDQNGGASTGAALARVFNVAPSIVALNASSSTINEGDILQVTGTIADPGVRDSFVLQVNWGDGTGAESFPLAAQSGFFVVSHRYLNDPPGQTAQFRPTFTLTDDDQGSDTDELAVEVQNVSPRNLSLIAPTAITEGGSISLQGTFDDPGNADTFVVAVDWGDGSQGTALVLPAGSRSFNIPHRYFDDASKREPMEFPIAVTIADSDGGVILGATRALVANLPPVVAILGAPDVSGVGTVLSLASNVIDPGTSDTFRYAWQVRKEGQLIAEGTEATFTMTPESTGVYVVSLQVLDDDEGVGTTTVSVVVVPCFLPGDINADCEVDLADLNNVRNHFGETGLGAIDLAFNAPVPGSLFDRNGVGSGFSTRLPGTGAGIAASDPNLDLLASPGRLVLKSTSGRFSDPTSWDGLEAPGVLLEGAEANDLRLSLALQNVRLNASGDELQLYAGASANKVLRAGVLDGGRFTVVYRDAGIETALFVSPMNSFTPGDNITLVLSRTAELWRLNWVNLSNPAASGASPALATTSLNGETDLYAGVYASNAPQALPFTAFLDYFTFDDLAPIPGDANGNHVVDLADLNAVRNNFGASSGPSTNSPLPEPPSREIQLQERDTPALGKQRPHEASLAAAVDHIHEADLVAWQRWQEATSSDREALESELSGFQVGRRARSAGRLR